VFFQRRENAVGATRQSVWSAATSTLKSDGKFAFARGITRALRKGMNDASVSTVSPAAAERWREMAGLMGELVIRAVGVGIAAGSLLLLTASVLV
jgi:hypothetical protein